MYADILKDLLEHVEDILFARREDATERMVEFGENVRGSGKKREIDLSWREATVEQRLSQALVHRIIDFIENDTEEARQKPRSTDDADELGRAVRLWWRSRLYRRAFAQIRTNHPATIPFASD